MFMLLVWGSLKLAQINYFLNATESLVNKCHNITVVSHSIYIVCVLNATISAILVSDVKPPY